jgi:hypothetical protein
MQPGGNIAGRHIQKQSAGIRVISSCNPFCEIFKAGGDQEDFLLSFYRTPQNTQSTRNSVGIRLCDDRIVVTQIAYNLPA